MAQEQLHHQEPHPHQPGAQPPNFHQLHVHAHHGLDLSKINLSGLSDQERDHLQLHQKHQGHEGMHALMLLILVVAIIVAQIGLIAWKKRHQKSYQNFSMFGMWLIPLFISIYNHWFRFIGIWFVITLITGDLLSFKPQHINDYISRLLQQHWFLDR